MFGAIVTFLALTACAVLTWHSLVARPTVRFYEPDEDLDQLYDDQGEPVG